MASIAIMLGGAVLNTSTFIGGSYLAKYLSGSKTDQERRRHDKAREKYQKDYAKYQENRQKLLDWQEQNRHEDAIASQSFENTDEAFKNCTISFILTKICKSTNQFFLIIIGLRKIKE